LRLYTFTIIQPHLDFPTATSYYHKYPKIYHHYSKVQRLIQSNMSKIITVFGATGNQGGSVINSLLNDAQLSKTFKIRGVTRDTSKPAAQELEKRGVELVKVRLSELHIE
jgi:hypothetical protein